LLSSISCFCYVCLLEMKYVNFYLSSFHPYINITFVPTHKYMLVHCNCNKCHGKCVPSQTQHNYQRAMLKSQTILQQTAQICAIPSDHPIPWLSSSTSSIQTHETSAISNRHLDSTDSLSISHPCLETEYPGYGVISSGNPEISLEDRIPFLGLRPGPGKESTSRFAEEDRALDLVHETLGNPLRIYK
jgi:hypothetical protein